MQQKEKPKIGIIGGTGLHDLFSDATQIEEETEFGKCYLHKLSTEDIEIFFVPRHGKNHQLNPSNVNYRANVTALWQNDVRHLISMTACGSLTEQYPPGSIVNVTDFIDFSQRRGLSLYDDIAYHASRGQIFCPKLCQLIQNAIRSSTSSDTIFEEVVYISIEGPAFSTRAESKMFKQFADIIGMTAQVEHRLWSELGGHYGCIGLVSDFDAWREDENAVTGHDIQKTMTEIAKVVPKLATHLITHFATNNATICTQCQNSTLGADHSK